MFIEKIRLDGKVAMVVGAGGGGHGTGTAIAAAEAGADVVGIDIRAEALADVERRVRATGRRFLGLTADVRDKREVSRVVDQALGELGRIDCLANIVGGVQAGQWTTLLECSEKVFDDTLALNLRTHFLVCQAVARSMVERKIAGSIVNVSSVSAAPTAPSHAAYGAAKRALNALSQNMALEWSEFGIRVNVVAPGAMRVPRAAALSGTAGGKALGFDDVATAVVPHSAPLGRAGTPVDIASAILFFFSDLASYVTGQLLSVDGGLSVKSVLTGDTVRKLPSAR
jgi:NAD(P)-dependent dehydrogenase (short-subunit alcohol dehydrogenase family)